MPKHHTNHCNEPLVVRRLCALAHARPYTGATLTGLLSREGAMLSACLRSGGMMWLLLLFGPPTEAGAPAPADLLPKHSSECSHLGTGLRGWLCGGACAGGSACAAGDDGSMGGDDSTGAIGGRGAGLKCAVGGGRRCSGTKATFHPPNHVLPAFCAWAGGASDPSLPSPNDGLNGGILVPGLTM
eukprot:1159460-Pelagomonas_calceolata.AAC.2